MKKLIPLFLTALLLASCTASGRYKKNGHTPDFAQNIITARQEQIIEEQQTPQEVNSPAPQAAKAAEPAKPAVNTAAAPKKQEATPVKQPEAAAPQTTESAQEKAAPHPPLQNDPAFIFSDDGRLLHPWYALPPAEAAKIENKPKWFGEILKFQIGWSFVTAGEADIISNKIIHTGEEYAYPVEAYAQSFPVIDKMFKVRDINASWISGDLKKSLGYWQSLREGRYKRDEWIIFDYKKNTFTVHKQNNKGVLSKETLPFKGEAVWDMLSALYYVRMQPIPLEGEILFDIINVKKQYPLKVIVHGKETVKVKAGKFNCIIVEPLISGEGIFVSKGKSLKVWLTDDEYKMPVKMTAEVFIGNVHAELISYKRSK